MPEALRRTGSFVGALAFVCGLIAVVTFLLGLANGDVSGRGAIFLVMSAMRRASRHLRNRACLYGQETPKSKRVAGSGLAGNPDRRAHQT